MNQESSALYQVPGFTVSNIRPCNVKNADQRRSFQMRGTLFFPDWCKYQIREASTSYMKSEPVRSGRWETWPELYKLSNTSLLGDEYFLREEVVQ